MFPFSPANSACSGVHGQTGQLRGVRIHGLHAQVFAILFRILTGTAITKMKGVSASNCTQVCKVETCQPPLVCAARAVRRPISSHCYPCDAIGAGARTLHAFQSLYKLPSENCVRLSTNIIPAELYLVSELKFLTTGQGRKYVSLSRNRVEIILNIRLFDTCANQLATKQLPTSFKTTPCTDTRRIKCDRS